LIIDRFVLISIAYNKKPSELSSEGFFIIKIALKWFHQTSSN